MFCPDCGKKNDSDAVYCDECGTRLIKPDIKPKSGTDSILLWWKNRKSNNAWGLIIVISVFISLAAISSSFNAPSNQEKENEPFEPYGNDSGTFYSSEYLSFSHNPFKTITHSNKLENVSDLVQADFENGDGVLVYKPYETTQSAYDRAVESKNSFNDESSRSSGMSSNSNIETIQIAGVTGYKLDSLNYNKGKFSSHSINIYFVKNGKLYQIGFTSVGRDTINQNQQNMDKILDSLTVF